MYPMTPQEEHAYENSIYKVTRNIDLRLDFIGYVEGVQTVFTNDKSKLLKVGFNYRSSCVPGTTFALGAANIDTLSIDLEYLDNLYAEGVATIGNNATLVYPYITVKTETAYDREICLGTFMLQNSICKVGSGKYTLKLQSLMALFDKNLPPVFNIAAEMTSRISELGLDGPTPLIILEWCCKNVAKYYYTDTNDEKQYEYMSLGSEMYDSSYLISLQNLDYVYNISQEQGYLTYRDIIKDIASICCSFATMTPLGELILIPFCTGGTSYSAGLYTFNDVDNQGEYIHGHDLTNTVFNYVDTFRIEAIRYASSALDDETLVETAYDYPPVASVADRDPSLRALDLAGLRILDTVEDKSQIFTMMENIYKSIGYEYYSGPVIGVTSVQDVAPYEITTVVPNFRVQCGDWCGAYNYLKDPITHEHRIAFGQVMSINWSYPGQCTYKSFTLPTYNDKNATFRQSETDRGQSGGSGTPPEPPPPPEPPVVILDDFGQWKFTDNDELIEEYEQAGQSGQTYHVPQIGQWAFEIPNI